jgi:hypothetical protein
VTRECKCRLYLGFYEVAHVTNKLLLIVNAKHLLHVHSAQEFSYEALFIEFLERCLLINTRGSKYRQGWLVREVELVNVNFGRCADYNLQLHISWIAVVVGLAEVRLF